MVDGSMIASWYFKLFFHPLFCNICTTILEDWHWYADWEVICRVKRPLGSSDRGGAVGRNMADGYGWDQIHKS